MSEKKFCNENEVGKAIVSGLIKIPEEPVDAIIIIGPLSCLPKGHWSCSSLRVVISILTLHTRKWKGRKKSKPNHYEKDFAKGSMVSKNFLSHNSCGGVTDRQFLITVAARKDSKFYWGPPKTVNRILSDALDHKLIGRLVPAPKRGDLNLSLGILEWSKCQKGDCSKYSVSQGERHTKKDNPQGNGSNFGLSTG